MAGEKETFVHPANALAGARHLTAAGTSFWSKWVELKGRIESLNAAKPWGDDEPGRKFSEQYTGGDNPAKQTLDAGQSNAVVFKDLGNDVTAAVKGTMDSDDLISKWYKVEGEGSASGSNKFE
jgi:hypothetical protein